MKNLFSVVMKQNEKPSLPNKISVLTIVYVEDITLVGPVLSTRNSFPTVKTNNIKKEKSACHEDALS